jgi:antitoxin component of MazEF toxin-antitoxin module
MKVRELNMTTVCIRKVIRIGGSLAIILPTQWAKGKVIPGQEMIVVGNGELRMIPVHEKVEKEEHETESESKE